ncbi:MAG: phospholipase [Spirochaetes bacterium]|nr:phospholipase [Spirochaetota bacterium]
MSWTSGHTVVRRGADPADAEAALVMLHGRGASAQSIIGLADELDTTGLSILAPEAEGNVWYPQSFLAPREMNQAGIDAAFAVIDGIMDELAAAGVDRARTVLLGFSQGACLASDYVFNHPGRFGGVIALSGGLIGPPGTDFRPAGDLEATPVFLGCSDVDPHIPAERVRETHEAFIHAGAAADMQLYPGMPHTVNAEEIARANDILRAVRS